MYIINKKITNHPIHRPKQGSPWVLLIICLLTTGLFNLAAVTTTANATDYYLADPKGTDGIAGTADDVDSSDSYPGTSDLPWQTIDKAFRTATYGDSVSLRDGHYGAFSYTSSSDFPLYSGSMTEPLPANTEFVTFKADSGHEPVFTRIELGNSSNNYYVPYIFEGIRIEPAYGDNGAALSRCVGPRFKNLTIVGQSLVAGYGVELEYGGDHNNDIRIEDSIIHTFKRGIHGYGSNLVIKGNEIYNIGEDHLILASGFNSGYNILIENNHIHHTNKVDPDAHPDGIAFMALKNVILRNNIIHDLNATQGIFDHGGAGSGSKNVLIENNLMYKVAVTELQFNDPTTATENWTLRNNTIIGDSLVQQVSLNSGINHNVYNNIFICGYSALDGAVDYHDYNIYIKRGDTPGNNEPHSYGYEYLGDWDSTHAVIEPELFVDPDNNNFRLKEGCRAINFGDPYNVPEGPNDLDGNPRVIDGRIDAGCYEYISGTPDTTPPSTPQNLSATPISEHQIDLSWDASIDTESGISHYNIYRDGNPIGQSSSTSYSDTGLNSD
ncbi:MAG: hypothetical protein ACYS67_05520, partial [Planctomycetota bacterium]